MINSSTKIVPRKEEWVKIKPKSLLKLKYIKTARAPDGKRNGKSVKIV